MFSVFFRETNQRLADFVWVVDMKKYKTWTAGRCFDRDIAVMKESREKAVYFNCYILDAKEIKLWNCAGE